MTGPVPPALRRAAKDARDKGTAGKKAEASLAKRLGGTLRPGSGAMDGAKGDVTVADFLIENKSSTNASFSVQQSHLHKIYQEALELSKTPALAFQFVNPQGQSGKRDRWVMVPESVWQELTEK